MTDQYFAERPEGPEHRRSISMSVWGRELTLQTANGVFAREGLDKGTAVLLDAVAPPVAAGTFLDLGCGYGPIALGLAAAVPAAQVWAVDVNERALALCRDNAVANDLDVRAVRPDDVPPTVTFDQIWSNPPIHSGKQALHELLGRWLPRLSPEGTAWLVVGRNLGADSLHRWLDDEGWPTRRVASGKGFRVLRVARSANRSVASPEGP